MAWGGGWLKGLFQIVGLCQKGLILELDWLAVAIGLRWPFQVS